MLTTGTIRHVEGVSFSGNIMTEDEIIKLAQEVAYELEGTSKFLQFVLEERGQDGMDNNSTFCAILDSLVFCCEQCDWWFSQSEMTDKVDRWICEDCGEYE